MSDRRAVLRRLVRLKRDVEAMIQSVANSDELRNYAQSEEARRREPPRQVELEDPEVVAERWGVKWDDDEVEMPEWFAERFKHLMKSEGD